MDTKGSTVSVHGPHIRRLRLQAELDISECAHATNGEVRYNHWLKIELGHTRRVSPGKFRAIRQALGLTPDESILIKGDPWGDTA